MKKVFLTLALVLAVGSVSAQTPEDKAKAKAEAAAMKAAQAEAKGQVKEAQKVWEALNAKIQEKTVTDEQIMQECRNGQDILQKAIQSGMLEEKKLSEVYNLSSTLALYPLNIMLEAASNKQPFDTLYFYNNLKCMTDALHNELKYTKVTKGETGNEAMLKTKKIQLASCGDYYIYAGQFETSCQRYQTAIESYDRAIHYKEIYPEIADICQLRISSEQIAYYAFHMAYGAKLYDVMEKYYDLALKFEDGALGTRQVRMQSYLDRKDTLTWAKAMHDFTMEAPQDCKDAIQILLAYYQKLGLDQMVNYANEVIARDPNVQIAHFGKGYALFAQKKYDEAFDSYVKCTELEPDNYDGWYQAGLCKYKDAIEKNSTISSTKDQTKAKAMVQEVKKLLTEAIPYLEKARELTPDKPDGWAYELKTCYSITGQAAKAAKMDKLF